MVLEHELGVVEQPTDQGGFPVIHAATGDEPQHRLVFVLIEVGLDIILKQIVHGVSHQKYPSCFFFSIDPEES